MDEMTDELWKSFNNDYEVSSYGRVRRTSHGRRTYPGRIMTPTLQSIGYLSVKPTVDGKNVHFYVHHLVAAAFIGPRPDNADINHIDGCKTNNHVSNLEYVSHAENMRHARRLGLTPTGERHGNAKLSNLEADAIREIVRSGGSVSSVARKFGVAPSTVSQIASGQRRKSE